MSQRIRRRRGELIWTPLTRSRTKLETPRSVRRRSCQMPRRGTKFRCQRTSPDMIERTRGTEVLQAQRDSDGRWHEGSGSGMTTVELSLRRVQLGVGPQRDPAPAKLITVSAWAGPTSPCRALDLGLRQPTNDGEQPVANRPAPEPRQRSRVRQGDPSRGQTTRDPESKFFRVPGRRVPSAINGQPGRTVLW